MSNEDHYAAIDKAGRRNAIAWSLLVFSVTCLVAASFGSLGAAPLLAFAGASALYALILRIDIFNEIEGAVLCEILLILALLLVAALQHAHQIAPKKAPKQTAAIKRLWIPPVTLTN